MFSYISGLQFLPKHQHIVIPDLPGHGGTDRIELQDDIYSAFVDKLHEVGFQKHNIHHNLKYIPPNIVKWTVFSLLFGFSLSGW